MLKSFMTVRSSLQSKNRVGANVALEVKTEVYTGNDYIG
jgi:hypothetical protein